MLIAFNKPYGVLSQFTTSTRHATLADYIDVPGVYAAGRLDVDSEGLLLMTDDGGLQRAIADPTAMLVKRYWAQLEGVPTESLLDRFRTGMTIGSGVDRYVTRPADACIIDAPPIAERSPPIRYRAHVPTTWIEVLIREGKNRQIRRMTAAIGHPTLRLMRAGIGSIDLFALAIVPGMSVAIEPDKLGFASKKQKLRPASGGTRGGTLSTGFRSRRYWG